MRLPLIPLLALLLLAAACGRPDPPPLEEVAPTPQEVPADAPPGVTPPAPGELGEVQEELTDAPPSPRRQGESIRLDPPLVIGATVERGGVEYDVQRRPRLQTSEGGKITPASAQAVDAWLARFAPLEAEGRLSDPVPQAVRERATHRVDFRFEDDTIRSVFFLQEGGRLAVISQADGPVFSLPPGRLEELVPPAEALR
jgi:hypothetical protein